MNSQTFLNEIYPDKPDNAYILLWKSKKSKWFTDTDKAAAYIKNYPKDVYYGVGLSPKNYGAGKRCKADDIMGIPGLYADIDIGEGSKKYPTTIEDGLKLVTNNGFDPTMVVNSGNGLHIYWLFKEIWIFDTPAERIFAASLCKRLNKAIRDNAIKAGFNIDNVGDLARILRPVGSLNCKKQPKPVEIITNNGPRYSDPDFFDKILPEIDEYDISSHEKVTPKELANIEKIINLKITAEPPQAKLDLLLEADPKFKMLWQKHKDAKKDTSPSGFHWDLAIIAAAAKWTSQEITNLLIAWNRRHNIEPEKLIKRADYVARTIGAARKAANELFAEEYTKDIEAVSGTEFEKAVENSDKKKAFEVTSHHLGFKIFSFTNFKQEKKNKYVMDTSEGEIIFRGTDEIHMKSKFEQRILADTNRSVSLSRKNFEVVKSMYHPMLVDVIVSRESSIESRMKEWIREYLDGKAELDQHNSVVGKKPFVHKGQWHIYATTFKEWAFRNHHDRDGINKTEFDLKKIGAEEKQMNPKHPMAEEDEKKRKRMRPWIIPLDIIIPEKRH